MNEHKIKKRIRAVVLIFIIALVFSGMTAYFIVPEANLLKTFTGNDNMLSVWINKAYNGIRDVNQNYPFIFYGTDWLAFGHLVIAIMFIGPYINPVRNKWVIQGGVFACIAVIPQVLITGYIREIPVFWQLFDCMFGILGIIPLLICLRLIRKMEQNKTSVS